MKKNILASCQVYYVLKVVRDFVESKAKKISITVALVRIFNVAVGKIFRIWYDHNMLNMTLVWALSLFSIHTSFAQSRPFPQHISYQGTHIKPSNYSQEELDKIVTDFYYNWRTKYLKSSCGAGKYFISFDDGETCVSEGQGYGMMIMPLMAGYDFNARDYFDGLYRYYKEHPSNINPDLMAWKQVNCVDEDGADAASDGDIDIAYGLLLAHVQWGSSGDINYLQEAINIINAIMKDEVNQETWTVKLGDWTSSGDNYYYSTRTSDFIIDHFRVFQCATNNNNWNNVVDTCYSLIEHIQTNYSSQTGLLPDFIIDVNNAPKPANSNFLEGENDGSYYYNACRDPWRLATDYLLFGDERAKTAVTKINSWLITKTGNDPNKIKSGYQLDGTEIATWDDASFIGPFTVGAMLDENNQQWLDDLFEKLLSYKFSDGDYYSNTLKLLNLLVISGNYWAPACEDLVAGIDKPEEHGIVIYPNPSKGKFVVEFDQDLPEKINVINLKGQNVLTIKQPDVMEVVDLSGYGNGVYIVVFELKNQLIHAKLNVH